MLQPFEVFRPIFVERLLSLKRPFLVTQTYQRGLDHFSSEEKVCLLLTDYEEQGVAEIHYKAVVTDPFGAIINLQKPAHKTKLLEMLSDHSRYHLYWAVVKSKKQLERLVNEAYKDKMRSYLDKNTNWRIDGNSSIRPNVQLIFGELFIVIKHANQTLRVKFEELEKS
jgi:hypothetical protein